jgi:hypothetical protein
MNYLRSAAENSTADANDPRIHVDNDFAWNYREIQFELNGKVLFGECFRACCNISGHREAAKTC